MTAYICTTECSKMYKDYCCNKTVPTSMGFSRLSIYEMESQDDCIFPCTSDKSPFSFTQTQMFDDPIIINRQPH